MTEETRKRLLERIEQILKDTDKKPQTLTDIEEIALQVRDKVAQAVVEEVAQEAQNQPDSESVSDNETSKICCPNCQGSAWYKGKSSRNFMTMAGTLVVSRRYYYCRRCNHGYYPLDNRLGLPTGSRFTDSVSQEIAFLSACLPFEQAVQTLYRFTKVCVSASSAQRLCLTQARQNLEAFLAERDRENLPKAFAPVESLSTAPPKADKTKNSRPACPTVLYLAADGIQTPMEEGSWKEMKVGVVRSEHGDGREDQASRYINHLGESHHFGSRWESLAIDCGSLTAKCLVVLGDGAPWLWKIAETRFPRAIQILDFWHALEYVGAVAREAFPQSEERRKEWLSARASEMKRSAWKQVHNSLNAVGSIASESVTDALRYFTNNASRMDYACYLKQGLCIGSGLAESSCKRLVTQRLKGSGMHWSERGAQVICSLRCLLLGREWDAFIAFWNRQLQTLTPSPEF